MTQSIKFTIDDEIVEHYIEFERDNEGRWFVSDSDIHHISINKFFKLVEEIENKIYIV